MDCSPELLGIGPCPRSRDPPPSPPVAALRQCFAALKTCRPDGPTIESSGGRRSNTSRFWNLETLGAQDCRTSRDVSMQRGLAPQSPR
eukprot:2034209-Alexandrium_andersonii.AAC.2